MRIKYFHKKLVRDNIPDIIKASGGEFKMRGMDNREFEKELKRKLIEEAKEVMRAERDEIPDELADVLEIIKSLSSHYDIPFKDIDKRRKQKKEKKGAFNKKLFLIWSTGQSGN